MNASKPHISLAIVLLSGVALLAACTVSVNPTPVAELPGPAMRVITVTPQQPIYVTATLPPTNPPVDSGPRPTPTPIRLSQVTIVPTIPFTVVQPPTQAPAVATDTVGKPREDNPATGGGTGTEFNLNIVPPANVQEAEQVIININNQYRANAGLAPMVRDETLMAISRARVQDMIDRGYMGHNDPVTNAHLGREMVYGAGYSQAGENWYASGQPLAQVPETAMTWFINDPPHAQGILSTTFTNIGVGVGYNGSLWIVVQNFATP